jgi:hypothetical protein
MINERGFSVSSNGRHLLRNGQPFLFLADTAWELFHRCTLAEANYYLARRQTQGFSVILAAVLAEMDGLHTPNANGDIPLIDDDPLKPNEAYFRLVDQMIAAAEAQHLVVGLLPTWGDKVARAWGIGPEVFNFENAHNYGEWLGKRYANHNNILWVLGGDRNPIVETHTGRFDRVDVWKAMADGLLIGTQGQALITYHPQGGYSSSVLHNESWLHFHMWQSGHSALDIPIWDFITQDRERQPVKPTLDGESNYEDHPIDPFTRQWQPSMGYFRDQDVRKQAYRSLLAGACGHTYGHHSVWQFWTPDREPINFPDRDWRRALDRPGAGQIQYVRWLFEKYPWYDLVPDPSLLATPHEIGALHVRAARALDNRHALIYLPQSMKVLLNRAHLKTPGVAQWYSPRDGKLFRAQPDSPIRTDNLSQFTPPSDGADWILILETLS